MARGRHRTGCGVQFPCHTGAHLSAEQIQEKICQLERSDEVLLQSRREEQKVFDAVPLKVEPVIEIAPKSTNVSTIKRELPVPNGMCQHRDHNGSNDSPGEYLRGLGVVACKIHLPPVAPSNAMSLRQANEMSRLWKQWERGFVVFQEI